MYLEKFSLRFVIHSVFEYSPGSFYAYPAEIKTVLTVMINNFRAMEEYRMCMNRIAGASCIGCKYNF